MTNIARTDGVIPHPTRQQAHRTASSRLSVDVVGTTGVRTLGTESGFRPEDIFEMTERRDGETAVLALSGELDLATVGTVERRLAELREEGQATVLDLDRLTFMDSTGIRL